MSGSALSIIIKITAVFLAVLLWFNVVTDKEYEYHLTLPVTAIDLPAGLALKSPIPDSITMRVLARGKKLLRDDWKEAGIRLHASRFRRGSNLLEMNNENVTLIRTEDVTVIGFPDNSPINIQLDRVDSVYKPIASRLAVICDPDYMVVGDQGGLNPDEVKVIGPSAIIRDIDSVHTESRIVDDIDESTTVVLKLVSGSDVPIEFSEDSVTVEVIVDKKGQRTLTGIPLSFRESVRGKTLLVAPERVDVTIAGPKSIVDTITAQSIRAVVHPPGSEASAVVVPEISLPANLTLESILPDSVRVALSQ